MKIKYIFLFLIFSFCIGKAHYKYYEFHGAFGSMQHADIDNHRF